MKAFKILSFLATFLFCSCWAEVPYDDVKFHIFDKTPRDFESRVFESMKVVKNFYARPEVAAAAKAGASIIGLVPFVGKIGRVLPMIQSMCGRIANKT